MNRIQTTLNPDLQIVEGNKSSWNHADHRRHGFHNLYRLARYAISMRAARVMPLEKRMDLGVAELGAVQQLTSLPWFSAMVVVQGQHILFERYAPDFGKGHLHSIQSITKSMVNLVVGQLVDEGILDLSHCVAHYIPEIGSGYALATLQQVLNMDLVNEYSEDFADQGATYYRHEETMGWRLPQHSGPEQTEREFLARIASDDTTNRSGHIHYKDANTQVLGWAVERASGRALRSFIAEIVDAAGLEDTLYITTDREGFPNLAGGVCLTARDLARYFALFIRRGHGIGDQMVGSEGFIEKTVSSGVAMPPPRKGILYSNHTMVSGRSLGHSGWGGQYAVANLDTEKIAVFFSVIENEHATNGDYLAPVIRMLDSIVTGDR
jgi:CubicO group peptidase (beta-lactamase class C family)